MLKRKSLLIFAIVFILSVTAFLFCRTAGLQVNADESPYEMVTTVSETEYFTITGPDPGNSTLVDFKVPEYVDGYFEIILPMGVGTIASGCFDATKEGNEKLAEYFVSITGSTVNNIEQGAFVGCDSLVEVCLQDENIANNLEGTGLENVLSVSIGGKSLHTVTNASGNFLFVRKGSAESTSWELLDYEGTATKLELPASIEGNDNFTEYKFTDYSIHDSVFADGEFTSVVFPDCITSIGSSAFYGNKKLLSINISKSVETIGAGAFKNCYELTDLNIDKEESKKLTIGENAFENCAGLRIVNIPVNTEIRQYAFAGCTSLIWAYVGSGSQFNNTAVNTDPSAIYFPIKSIIIFSDWADYNQALNSDKTFKQNNSDFATYFVNVNFYIGDSKEPDRVETRMFGKKFDYTYNAQTGEWNNESVFADLPAQADHYASTVWYAQRELKAQMSVDDVNHSLASAGIKEVNLYCYDTVSKPDFQAEPVTWIYDSAVSYNAKDISSVLDALACKSKPTEKELAALSYTVVYADSDSKVSVNEPETISEGGVYSITFTLNSEYGAWNEPAVSSITINVDTSPFLVILIVFIVLAAVAAIVTASTAIIRKKVQAKNKKKQLSSKEVLEKFRSIGGETDLK